MLGITEYGEIVFATLDELGRRKIDGLLEDGTKIIIIVDYIIAIEMSTIKPIQILCEDI